MTTNYTNFNKDKPSSEISSNNQIKTTDVNVLLNRVKLDKKKTFKKKYNSFAFVSWFNLCDCHLFYYLDHKSWLKVY